MCPGARGEQGSGRSRAAGRQESGWKEVVSQVKESEFCFVTVSAIVSILILDVMGNLLGSGSPGRASVEVWRQHPPCPLSGWPVTRPPPLGLLAPASQRSHLQLWPFSPRHPGCPSQCLAFRTSGRRGKKTSKHLNSVSDSGKHLEVSTNTVFFWGFFSLLFTQQYLSLSSTFKCPLATFSPNAK